MYDNKFYIEQAERYGEQTRAAVALYSNPRYWGAGSDGTMVAITIEGGVINFDDTQVVTRARLAFHFANLAAFGWI